MLLFRLTDGSAFAYVQFLVADESRAGRGPLFATPGCAPLVWERLLPRSTYSYAVTPLETLIRREFVVPDLSSVFAPRGRRREIREAKDAHVFAKLKIIHELGKYCVARLISECEEIARLDVPAAAVAVWKPVVFGTATCKACRVVRAGEAGIERVHVRTRPIGPLGNVPRRLEAFLRFR